MSKKYKLLKDLPDADAGTVLTFDGDNSYDYKYKRLNDFWNGDNTSWYRKDFIENNPDWFEEVKEQERITVGVAFTNDRHCYALTSM